MLLFSERSEKVTFKMFHKTLHEQWIHNVYDNVLNIIKDQIALNGRIILTLLESVHITLRERSLLVGNGITVISVGHVTLKMSLVIVTSYFSQIVIELHHYKSN